MQILFFVEHPVMIILAWLSVLLRLLVLRLGFEPSRVQGQEPFRAQLALRLTWSITMVTKLNPS